MKKIVKILLAILHLSIWAAVPTMEGLFRNGINPDVTQDLIVLVLKATVKEVKDTDAGEPLVSPHAFYKIIYNNSAQGIQDIIIAKFATADVENDNIVELRTFRNERELISSSPNLHKQFSLAIMNMYATNSSSLISTVLKSIDDDFMTNREMVNTEKKELLEKYRRYLQTKKNYEKQVKEMKKNGATVEEMGKVAAPVSPLVSDNEEEKNQLEKIMSNSLYIPNKMIKLVKDGADFFWHLETSKISAKFKNDTHLLKVLKVNNDGVEYTVLPHDYVTFQGEYLLPKKFTIKTNQVESEFQVENYYLVNSKNKSFSDRIEDYKKLLDKNPKRKEQQETVEFKTLKEYFF